MMIRVVSKIYEGTTIIHQTSQVPNMIYSKQKLSCKAYVRQSLFSSYLQLESRPETLDQTLCKGRRRWWRQQMAFLDVEGTCIK